MGKFAELADKMQAQIDEKRNPATAQQRVTPRRARMIQASMQEAESLETIQSILYRVDREPILPNGYILTSKAQVETLVREHSFPTWDEKAVKRLEKLDVIDGSTFDEARSYVLSLVGPKDEESQQAKHIRELEFKLIGCKIPGYFPTPRTVIEFMLSHAAIKSGMNVLEPSAGKGDIADVIQELYPDVFLRVCEINHTLQELLEAKGYKFMTYNFLEHGWPEWDRIIMNPPFEKGQDADHIRHAHSLLREGGRVVSIAGEGIFFRNDKKSVEFRDWMESVGGFSEKLEAGAFYSSDRPTGVSTRLVVIDK